MGHLQKRYDQLDKQDKELNKVLAKAKTPTQLLKEGSQNNPAVQRRNREQAKRDADTQRMYDRANERAKKDIQEIKDEIKNRGPHTKEERAKLDQMLARAQARLNQKPMTREQFQAGLRKMKP